ncbi:MULTISPECIES: GAF domain-containing protein [Gordonia]|uniref:Transcriptional regulator n=1 Tax=Gordonia amicalis TaxID=89053 RepID=A0AAE4U1P2_9ACTN|nr:MULTISPECIES: GAF domain-containing protein [Gordonia]ATD69002.1 diguanylate phosphodiesterase [Gordonia sp. 1D]MCZ0910937.1 transcriptional regulator [Gordonia amicalis]MCZ4581056.1 transcriptional regulator [Gordonia amicalis]MCZ4653533.1 transcriptional regulator [Gordonia amicalis]MDJ0454850.1 transcriptional regulator [Gordonia amicalis]
MTDAAAVATRIRRAYEEFLSGVTPPSDAVRSIVRDSWARSLSRGIDPSDVNPADGLPTGESVPVMTADEFAEYRAAHPITAVRPLVQSLMVDAIADTGVVVALTDQVGRLLWVEGDSAARDKAGDINFVEGSVWSEEAVGTNAPGLALTVDRGVQIVGPEHFAGPVQEWSCAAAPVHDPFTGHVIGVIDVTGGREVAAPFALAAVRSVVAAVERELQSSAVDLADPATFHAGLPRSSAAHLAVLGDGPHRWRRTADGASARTVSPRHAEILVLLQAFPEGLNTEQLALKLAEEGLDPVSVRAEISRLRRDLGADVVASRPYRLTLDISSDISDIRARIESGTDLPAVVDDLGRGGLLVESTAPGIVEIFEELREDLRSRLIAGGDVAALRKWTSSVHGRDDLVAWRRLEHRLPVGHPDRAVVGGRIRLLDKRYGL